MLESEPELDTLVCLSWEEALSSSMRRLLWLRHLRIRRWLAERNIVTALNKTTAMGL